VTTTETVSVALVTAPPSAGWATVEGSPLDGHARVHHLDLGDSMTIKSNGGVPYVHWNDSVEISAYDAAIADVHALVVAPWTFLPAFTEERWRRASTLKVIAGTFDNRFDGWLDVAEAERRGVVVIDTSRAMTPTVAEFALAMTLNLLRDIPTAIQLVREGSWKTDVWDQPGFVYGDLTGRAVGLAGYGSINRRYAELLSPFRCSVRAYDPFVPESEMRMVGIEPVDSLLDLASRSEILVIGIPPTPATRGIISAEVIEALPRGAAVVLVTRMAVVEQDALWRRAENGELRVAVDVFEPEPPPPDASFRTSPYVLPTPHIAGDTEHCHRRCFTSACADALSVLRGEAPLYRVSVRDDLLYRGALEKLSERGGP